MWTLEASKKRNQRKTYVHTISYFHKNNQFSTKITLFPHLPDNINGICRQSFQDTWSEDAAFIDAPGISR